MAEETRRFVIHITGEGTLEEKEDSGKNALKTFAKATLHPLSYAKSQLMEKAEALYKTGKPSLKAAGASIGIGLNAATEAIKFAKASANFAWSRYTTLQEDYIGEQFVNNVETTINKATGAINSVAQGAMTGSVFGTAGAVTGALIGAVSYAGGQYIQYQQRMSGYYRSLNSSNYQAEFSQTKLGLINNGRGTEN